MNNFFSTILFLFSSVLLLFSGCRADDWDTPNPTTADNKVYFTCHADDYIQVTTRGAVGLNRAVYLFTFDGNGSLLEVVHARAAGTSDRYEAVLDATNRVRVVHFLALSQDDNSPIQAVISNPDNYKGKDERELMNRFSTSSDAFWRRKAYTALPEDGNIGPVNLLRNRAAIKVTQRQDVELPQGHNFEILGWAFYGYSSNGTYAPYDPESDLFPTTDEEIANRPITVPADMQYVKPTAAELEQRFSNDSLVFERRQNLDDNLFFVILKAKFGVAGAEQVCYYKLQLTDGEELERLDIIRNYLYNMEVVEVGKAGAPTVQAALDGPVANDATISIELSFYNKITNGHETLEVERTAYMFSFPSRSFAMKFTYTNKQHAGAAPVPKLSRAANIDKAFEGGTLQIASVDVSQWVSEGKITGTVIGTTTATIPPLGDIKTKFTVKVGRMAREVRIRVVKPLEYAAPQPTFTPTSGTGASVGDVYTLNFKLPADVDKSLFPMKFYIDTKIFTPTDEMLADGKLYIENLGNDYRYVYTAHDPGESVSLKFRRNLTNPGVLTLLSENFVSKRFPLYDTNIYEDLQGTIVVDNSFGETPVPQGANVKMYPLNIADYGFKVIGEGRFSMIVKRSLAASQQFTFTYTLPEGRTLTPKTYTLGDLRTNKKIVFDDYNFTPPVTGQLVTFETGNGGATGERALTGPDLTVSSTANPLQYKFTKPTLSTYSISFREDCPANAVFTFKYRHPNEGILMTVTKTRAQLAAGEKITFPFWWVSGDYAYTFGIIRSGNSILTPSLDPDKYNFSSPSSRGRYSFAVSGDVPLSENPTFTIEWRDWFNIPYSGTYSKSQLLNNGAGGFNIKLS